jgi:hypothetical protein
MYEIDNLRFKNIFCQNKLDHARDRDGDSENPKIKGRVFRTKNDFLLCLKLSAKVFYSYQYSTV